MGRQMIAGENAYPRVEWIYECIKKRRDDAKALKRLCRNQPAFVALIFCSQVARMTPCGVTIETEMASLKSAYGDISAVLCPPAHECD